jgi:hypothetical protein
MISPPANPIANNTGDGDRTTTPNRWTTRGCPPEHIGGIRDMGNNCPSRVDAHNRSTLQQRVVVPNPQHLLLTLNIETSLHEEKCPL